MAFFYSTQKFACDLKIKPRHNWYETRLYIYMKQMDEHVEGIECESDAKKYCLKNKLLRKRS